MITDFELTLENTFDLDQAAATYLPAASGNWYDTRAGKSSPDNTTSKWGATPGLFPYVSIGVAPDNLTSVRFEVISASNVAFTSDVTTHFDSGVVLLAALTTGYELDGRFAPNDTWQRYVGWRVIIAGTTSTAGGTALLAIGPHRDVRRDYASGLTFHS